MKPTAHCLLGSLWLHFSHFACKKTRGYDGKSISSLQYPVFAKLFGALECHCWTRPRMLLLHCPVTSSPDPTACAYSNAPAEVPPQIHPCSISKSCSGSGRFGKRHNKARVPRWAAQQHCPRVYHLGGIFPSPPKSTPSSSRLGRTGKSSPSGCYKHLGTGDQVTSLWQSKYTRSLAVWHFSLANI